MSVRAGRKPAELVAVCGTAAWLFGALRSWFDVPEVVEINLGAVDAPLAVSLLTDRGLVAAMAMRKLQALHYAATPGNLTAPDVIVTLIEGVTRALVEAPDAFLERMAKNCDWDEEFAALDNRVVWQNPGITDDEIEHFKDCVDQLLSARAAVMLVADSGHKFLL